MVQRTTSDPAKRLWKTPEDEFVQVTADRPGPETPILEWIRGILPGSVPPGEHHQEFWKWIDSLEPSNQVPAFIACWPRGGGKSTTCELGAVRVEQRQSRRFLLIVARTQEQADERVSAIRTHFERHGITAALTMRGTTKGWRRGQLRTASGFNIAGFGMDRALRGLKLDDVRPDWIHFDDIDSITDTPGMTAKKERIITHTILKAASTNCAVSYAQNMIIHDGIMGRLLRDKADFLRDRVVSGPIPAIVGLRYEQYADPATNRWQWRIISGVESWEGQSIASCQYDMNKDGLPSFLEECQHEIEESIGGLWDGVPIRYLLEDPPRVPLEADGKPTFTHIVITLDPSGSMQGDEVGLTVCGKFRIGMPMEGGDEQKLDELSWGAVVLEDCSAQMSPNEWAELAVEKYHYWSRVAHTQLLAEVNFGGEMVAATVSTVKNAPRVVQIHVSRGKILRAHAIKAIYEQGRSWHAHKFPILERQMTGWKPGPGAKSPGAMDSMVIGLTYLLIPDAKTQSVVPYPASRMVTQVPRILRRR